MKKISFILLVVLGSVLTSAAQDTSYRILSESDYTAKAKLGGNFSFGSRQVKLVVYEYPSTDVDGKAVTISGVIMIPSNILDGSVPCDGVVMYNHYTVGSPDDVPSKCGKGLNDISALVANPLRPNYIIVACDYIGYGSSADHMVSYISGDTNSRNALDGLLAARQFFKDRDIPQGKYLFNVGFSQGGTVSMFAAKLTDTEKKYKDMFLRMRKDKQDLLGWRTARFREDLFRLCGAGCLRRSRRCGHDAHLRQRELSSRHRLQGYVPGTRCLEGARLFQDQGQERDR